MNFIKYLRHSALIDISYELVGGTERFLSFKIKPYITSKYLNKYILSISRVINDIYISIETIFLEDGTLVYVLKINININESIAKNKINRLNELLKGTLNRIKIKQNGTMLMMFKDRVWDIELEINKDKSSVYNTFIIVRKVSSLLIKSKIEDIELL